jgi:KaiC/GvpD/RAD55 family RecA-like ATPase
MAGRQISRHQTGIGPLDRELDGGFTAGSVVFIRAPPHVPAEKIIQSILVENTPSTHATLLRPQQAIRQEYAEMVPADGEPPQVSEIGQASRFSEVSSTLERSSSMNVVAFEPISELEESDRGQFREFLRTATQVARAEQSTIVLFGYTEDSPTEARKKTLGLADVVCSIDEQISGQQAEYYLHVSKNRLGPQPTGRMKFTLADDLAIDTSRDIA